MQIGVRLREYGGGSFLGERGVGGLGLAARLQGGGEGKVGGYLRQQRGVWRVAS